MLTIDENMLRLAKMQETLLKVSKDNRIENLEKYINTVTEIDAKAFEYIMEKTKHIDEHNHSLEEELEYLKEIKNLYDQLIELQTSFKDNCKVYGNKEIQLSDLSGLDIDYITNRINAIDSYLSNLKNIELNKEKIQKLSEKLIEEEKKKIVLDDKLEELEQTLRDGFGSVEGRTIVDGKLEYTNVILEYKKINLDFERLINDSEYLRSSISYVRNEKREISEKVKVAEVCYSTMPNAESKQILDEINIEDLKVKYKLTMLEILELLTKKCDGYDSFIEKRKSMLDLIKYRLVCMESLGMKTSVDPFSRIKVKEQLDIVKSLTDNSKVVSDMMHEISKLNSMTEEMIFQNNGYLITINDIKGVLEDRTSFGDIDITPTVSFDELLIKQSVSDNQVVRVRSVSSKLKMGIISQKTSSVINRVNQMLNLNDPIVKKQEEVVPELVIVPVSSKTTSKEIKDEVIISEEVNKIVDESFDKKNIVEETEPFIANVDDEPILVVPEPVVDTSVILPSLVEETPKILPVVDAPVADIFSEPSQLFETITPFEQPPLFSDRAEGDFVQKKKEINSESIQLDKIEFVSEPSKKNDSVILSDIEESMPDVFWITQDDEATKVDETTKVLSFDEQINALLSQENNDNGKVRKKVA